MINSIMGNGVFCSYVLGQLSKQAGAGTVRTSGLVETGDGVTLERRVDYKSTKLKEE